MSTTGIKRNGLYLEDKIKIVDWLRKIGQPGIDQAKLTSEEIAAKAAELIKKPVTTANVKDILASVGLRSCQGVNPKESVKALRLIDDLTARVETLETACKTAGIWPV